MYIGNYTLDAKEESIVSDIFERLKAHFPNLRMDCRSEILGIGEEGRQLICYFAVKSDRVCVKFKRGVWLDLCNSSAISEYIDLSVKIFNSEDMALKKRQKTKISKVNTDADESPKVEKVKKRGEKKYAAESRKIISVDTDNVCLDFLDKAEESNALLYELIDHIYASASVKITKKEKDILLLRLGIVGEMRTLDDIGNVYGISRERVRQIMNKAKRKIGHRHLTDEKLTDLEHQRTDLALKIKKLGATSFFASLIANGVSPHLISFIGSNYLCCDIDVKHLKQNTEKAINNQKAQTEYKKRVEEFNSHIYRLITFGKKRKITEDDFARLKTERAVNVYEKGLQNIIIDGKVYFFDSLIEKRILLRLLENNTFKQIKTQSLRVPFKDHYFCPDFQCLTHDGHLVLIDVKNVFNMCRSEYIEKFDALKEYSLRYGFGYLITDDRGNSFDAICEENHEYEARILKEIDAHGHIAYDKYKRIVKDTEATAKNLLTVIKKHKLQFSLPFILEK